MIDDERLEDELEVFYREAPRAQPHQQRVTADVLAAIRDESERRGGWWPFHRRPADDAAASQPGIRPDRIPAIQGDTTIITRRIWTMFSPAKAITVGALIFAIGGVLLVTSPFHQPGDPVPGAAADGETAFVTGTIEWGGTCSDGRPVMDGGRIVMQLGASCGPHTVKSDDARLAGTSIATWNKSIHRTADERSYSIRSVVEDIRGEGGGWVCRTDAALDVGLGGNFYPDQVQGSDFYQCAGDGDNAGLTALLVVTRAGSRDEFEGLIFPGDLPPAAELSPAE